MSRPILRIRSSRVSPSRKLPAGSPQIPGSSSSLSGRRTARIRSALLTSTATECLTGRLTRENHAASSQTARHRALAFRAAAGFCRRRFAVSNAGSLAGELASTARSDTNRKESIGRKSAVTPTQWQDGARPNRNMPGDWGMLGRLRGFAFHPVSYFLFPSGERIRRHPGVNSPACTKILISAGNSG